MQTPLLTSACAPIPAFLLASQLPLQAPLSDDMDVATLSNGQITAPRTGKTPLLVIEDHASLVDGMRSELMKEYAMTNVCTKDELLSALQEKNFALAVVDLTLHQKLEGFELMPLLKQAGIKFMVFSGTVEDWHILAAIRFGAWGYVNKRKKLFHLRRALQAIAKGETAFPPEIMAKMHNRKTHEFPSLGPAETELINILVTQPDPDTKGIPTNPFLRAQMHISTSRIDGLFRTLYSKFNIKKSSRALLQDELYALGYYPGVPLTPFGKLGIKL